MGYTHQGKPVREGKHYDETRATLGGRKLYDEPMVSLSKLSLKHMKISQGNDTHATLKEGTIPALEHETDLYKIQAGVYVMLHDEYRQVAMRLLYAVVEHANENIGVVLEFHHKLLVFLHHLRTNGNTWLTAGVVPQIRTGLTSLFQGLKVGIDR